MTVPAIIAAALQGSVAPAWSLTLDGLNVAAAARLTGYGVLWGTVQLTVAGAGGASSIVFQVDDPAAVLTFTEGMECRLVKLGQFSIYDTAHGGLSPYVIPDAPWFRGVVEYAASSVLGLGRVWTIRATGVDAIPDWCTTDYPVTFAAGASMVPAMQAVIAACGNRGEIVANLDTAASSQGVGPDKGIGSAASTRTNVSGATLTIAAGTSMRRALEQIWSVCNDGTVLSQGFRMTIDAYGSVRIYQASNLGAFTAPDGDFGFVVATNLPGTAPFPSAESSARDGTTAIRQVTVYGAAGVSAKVSDGSGRRGRSATFTDLTLTTAAQCASAGLAYLQEHVTTVRGELTVESNAAPGLVYEAAWILQYLNVTDPILGGWSRAEIGGFRVTFDHKTANPDIAMTYGGRAQSAAELIRRQAGSPLLG